MRRDGGAPATRLSRPVARSSSASATRCPGRRRDRRPRRARGRPPRRARRCPAARRPCSAARAAASRPRATRPAELDQFLVDGVGGEHGRPLAPAVGRGEGRLADARDEVVDEPDAGAAAAGDQAPAVPAQDARALEGDSALEARVDEQPGRRQEVVVGAAAPAAAEQRRLPAHGKRGSRGVEGEQRRHESGVETCRQPDRFRARPTRSPRPGSCRRAKVAFPRHGGPAQPRLSARQPHQRGRAPRARRLRRGRAGARVRHAGLRRRRGRPARARAGLRRRRSPPARDDFEVLFASKAFPCTAVLRVLARRASAATSPRGGELRLALRAGFDPARDPPARQREVRGASCATALDAGVGHDRGRQPRRDRPARALVPAAGARSAC